MLVGTMQTSSNSRGEADFEVRHRNPAAQTYVVVSRVIVVGYPQLSDGAKVTYLAISSHDWYDQSRGARKGFAFPTVRRLADLRHCTARTVQNHLAELIAAELLTREIRAGKPSILYIEEPSEKELDRYLGEQQTAWGENSFGAGVKISSPHKQEEEKQEEPVNGNESVLMEERKASTHGLIPLGQVLAPKVNQATPTVTDEGEWLVQEMAAQTSDQARMALACYQKIATGCPADLIFEALSILKQARTEGDGVRNRGAFFVATVHRLCRERSIPDPLEKRNGIRTGHLAEEAPATEKGSPLTSLSYSSSPTEPDDFGRSGRPTDRLSGLSRSVRSGRAKPQASNNADVRAPNWLNPRRKT